MGLFGHNSKEDKTPSQTVIQDVCKAKKGETVLIIANPETNNIAQDLFTAANEALCNPTLIYQNKKAIMDDAEKAVIAAIKSEPDIILSISANKLGKDSEAIANPIKAEDGSEYNSTFDYLLEGKKCTRAIWTPGLTLDMFERTVNIDYKLLNDRCKKLCDKYNGAVSVHVTSPNGTDVIVPVAGRKPASDNGDFSTPGKGGNIPAGEVFVSPVVGSGNVTMMEEKDTEKITKVKDSFALAKDKLSKVNINNVVESVEEAASAVGDIAKGLTEAVITSAPETEEITVEVQGTNGTIVFDGSMSFSDGDQLLETPITCKVENGFVTDITGGEEAKRLLKDITAAEKQSIALESSGKLPEGMGQTYCRNARNIGELGIGLNPAANITGNMLEDEKAFRTCHFAIGQNYDGDAPALIHFDGVVRNPTIEITYSDGKKALILDKGDLCI